MGILQILQLVSAGLPALVQTAEGFFNWKKQSGSQKKALVTSTVKATVDAIDAESTGGQKNTWDKIAPVISSMVDEAAAAAFPPASNQPGGAVAGITMNESGIQ